MSLPANISSWLRKNGSAKQIDAAKKIGQWCDRLGHKVVNGTAIGKYYDTLILDLTYHGSEIYIHENGFDETEHGYPGVTINDVPILDGQGSSFKVFAQEVEKIFGSKNASINARVASQLVKIAKELVAGGLGSEDEKKLKKDIEKAKKKIEQQVMRSGVKEDLGRKEVRELKDKYNYYNSSIGKLIKDFDNWIEEHIEMWIDGVR